MLQESKKEHGVLSQRLVDLDKLNQALAELDRDLLNLRKQGKKTAPERRTRFAEPEAPSKEMIETVITELGICKDHLSNTYKTARPMQRGMKYLDWWGD